MSSTGPARPPPGPPERSGRGTGERYRLAIIGSRGYPSTYGGFETLVRRLAPHLAETGHQVTVYGHGRGLRPRRRQEGPVTAVDVPVVPHKAAATLTSGLASAAHLLTSRPRPDATLVLNVANGYFLPALRARGVPTAVNVDGLEWERGKWGPTGRAVFRAGARLVARFADRVVVDSRAIGAVWTRQLGVADPVFLPYGADVTDPGTDRLTELDLTEGSYALVVARLAPENNVDLFLDATERLGGRHPVVVVGSANYDNPTVERLRHLADRGTLRWLGHVHDQQLLAQLWRGAGVYVHGHSVGGTNPALLQALGYGSPVLALDTPFNREVVEAEMHLFPPDPDVLADRIRSVLADPAEQRRLSVHGRAVVAERYRWEDVCEGYRLVLEALARDGRRPAGARRVMARGRPA